MRIDAAALLKSADPIASPVAAGLGCAIAQIPRSPCRRPIIVRPGGMGDLICAHIALEAIGVDPRAVTWLIERRSTPWARHAGLDHVAYDAAPRTVGRMIGTRSLVINTEQRFGLSQATARAIRHRRGRLVSFATSRARWASSDTVPYDWDSEHEVNAFMRLFALALGAPSSERRPIAARRIESVGTLVVALGGTHAPSRTLSLESWLGYIDRWAGASAVEIVAGPAEVELASQLAAALHPRARYEARDFPGVCETIAGAERVLAIDGGLVHVASYYGVPVTTLFTSGRDRKWAPLAQGSTVIAREDLGCRPCTRFGQTPPCPHSYACRDVPIALVPPARVERP